ncbi:hypothetical protein LMTR13_19175 [Bradyrhizobium icense]|uniref:Uncharacterized protein n=2 Tax=Bradyrhizobium icense TaxID=1274631 RepID=A0A1B1UGU4_9BRAD|nr:hypothetical protein LMTR13_19175 [Bradyrhizobium icense]
MTGVGRNALLLTGLFLIGTFTGRNPMSIYRLVGAAAALAVMTAPAMAQQVMGEPGYCAFYYPNANCQNKGPGNPYTDPRRFNQGYLIPDGPAAAGLAVKKRVHRPLTSMQ